MTPAQLKYAVTVAQESSVNKAAQKLFVAQPNISRALHELESELKFMIFVRTPQGMELTPLGEEFIIRAQSIVDETEELLKLGSDNPQKHIRISLTRSSYLMAALSEWVRKETFVNLPPSIHFRETNNYNIINDVGVGHSELGIIRIDNTNQSIYEDILHSKNLVSEKLFSYQMSVVLRSDHPLAAYSDIPYLQLKNYPQIVHGDDIIPSLHQNPETLDSNDYPLSSDSINRILVYDRGSLILLLHRLENAYMWTSPIPKDQLDMYHMVIRPCSFASSTKHDVLIYKRFALKNPLIARCIDELKAYTNSFRDSLVPNKTIL